MGRTTGHLATAGLAVAVTLVMSGTVPAATPPQAIPPQAGPGQGGTAVTAKAVTPSGYAVTPTGKQTDLGDLPLGAALAPDGSRLVVSNDGEGVQSLQVIDTNSGAVTQTLSYPSPAALYSGLAFSPDGLTLYASGGGNNLVRTYSVSATGLTEKGSIRLPTTTATGAPVTPFPAGIAVTPDGARLVVADQEADAVSVIDLATDAVHTTPVGHRPYDVLISPDGRTAYVTDQGGSELSVVDLSGPEPVQRRTITVGTHPNRLIARPDGSTLYVADGDSDEVSVVDTTTDEVTRTISMAPYPGAPVGSNPDAIALSEDGRTLYVANAGNNDVAFVDIRSGHINGLAPTAWYPTTLTWTGTQLFVTNAKGLGAGPNDLTGRPDPFHPGDLATDQYAGSMMGGTLTRIDVPTGQLQKLTQQVRADDRFPGGDAAPVPAGQDTGIVPLRPGEQSPIKHVIYVVRHGRTYDQELGSLGKGNGDAALDMFGDGSAPNTRNLARTFGDFDNFYADAEVGAQGANWAVAGGANGYSEQLWPAAYSDRNGPSPRAGSDPATAPNRDPAQAYIWDRLAERHLSFRNYGVFVTTQPDGSSKASDPVLDANTDHSYRGFDLACPDSPGTFPAAPSAKCGDARFTEWQKEFDKYVANDDLPAAELIQLPGDHTAGMTVGSPTPGAYVADDDWALGRLVDVVSHSKYWASTAIFVVEDNAQNGADHVDAHRTVAEVISPYSRTGKVDSTFYSTASMLHTMELILGLQPLTQFDADATPMLAAFTSKPDLTPYRAVKPAQNMQEVTR